MMEIEWEAELSQMIDAARRAIETTDGLMLEENSSNTGYPTLRVRDHRSICIAQFEFESLLSTKEAAIARMSSISGKRRQAILIQDEPGQFIWYDANENIFRIPVDLVAFISEAKNDSQKL